MANREEDAARCIQAAVRGVQVRNPRPEDEPGSVEAEREIERAKAVRIRQLRSDAEEAAKAIAMLRTKQQDEEIQRLRALVSERESVVDELRAETGKSRGRRLGSVELQHPLVEPEPEPEPEPQLTSHSSCVSLESGDVGAAKEPRRGAKLVRYGSAASAGWAAAAKLEADISRLCKEEKARAQKNGAARAGKEAAEKADDKALAAAAVAQKMAAAKLAALIETVRLEALEADEAASRATKRVALEAQAMEAEAKRSQTAEAEESAAAVELARNQAAAVALRIKEEQRYQAGRAAAEAREAAVRAAEEIEFEAAKARALERETARQAFLLRIAGSTGFQERRHLTHTAMRMESPKMPPKTPVLATPSSSTGRKSAESHRRLALEDAEQRLNSLQKQLEVEKSELQKELSEGPEFGTKTEGTPPSASYVDLSIPSTIELHSIAHQLDDVETAPKTEAEKRRATTLNVQTRCKVAITRAQAQLSSGAYVAAAAGFEEVVHVFRSYVVALPLPQKCSSDTVTMAKLYAQAKPLGLNQEEVDEVLDAFRHIAATLERHGLSESSVARVKQKLDETDTRTAAELSAYLTHDPGQQSLRHYRAAVRGLARLENTISAGEQDAVHQRSSIIETIKAGLVRVESRAEDQGKAAGIILTEEAQPAREVLQRLENTVVIDPPRALFCSAVRHERGVLLRGFPGEWRRCPICTLENPCAEHSGLQQRCHQLAQLTQLLQSEDVQTALAHAKATARSRQALIEQKQREEREAAEAEAQRVAQEAARQAEDAQKRASRVYFQVQVICAQHLSSAAARSSWTCIKKLRSSLDPRCELLICDAGGLISKLVQWTPTRHMTSSPNWGRHVRWVRNSKRGWDLWRRLCCGGDTARDTCRRLVHTNISSSVSPDWAAGNVLIPDDEPTPDKRGLWYCPSAIRVPGGEDGAIPQKAVTFRVWDHNQGYRKRAAADTSVDANCWCARRYEKISDMLCGTARLELPAAWEELLSIQKTVDDAAIAEKARLDREAILQDPYAVQPRPRRSKVDPAEADQRRRESFRGGVLTVPLRDAEGPLIGDDGKPSTLTVKISIWSPPEPGRLWWHELLQYLKYLKYLYVPCIALVALLGVALTALASWLLVRPPIHDCWEVDLPSTVELFGEEVSACQVEAPTATVEGTNPYVTLRWPMVSGATGYRIQEWSWQQLQTGWYDARRHDDSFSFLYNYGGTELPSCGTARLIPHSVCKGRVCEVFLTGRAELDVEWRYQAVKESNGETSRWSPPSNRMELPPGLLTVPFDLSAINDAQWEPAPLELPNTCCPVGLYTTAAHMGTERCTFCPAGQSSVNSARGQTSCDICPAGQYADPANAMESSIVAAARFARNEKSGTGGVTDGLACTPCGFNTFAASPGAAVCTPCATGWVAYHGAKSCWVWFPYPILAVAAICAGSYWRRRTRREELGRKYLSTWIRRTMNGPISSWWRGDELIRATDSSVAIISHGRDTHAARAIGEAAEVGVRAASGLTNHHQSRDADKQQKSVGEAASNIGSNRVSVESPTSAFELDSVGLSQEPTSGVGLRTETDAESHGCANDARSASYRRFDKRNVHQIYANGSAFAAHAALWRPQQETGVGTPRGKSGAGLLSGATVRDELRQVLLHVTAEAGDAWKEEDREECRVNFDLIAKDAESSETGVSWTELGNSVTAVLERLPGSIHNLARTEPPSPATTEATTHRLAVVSVLPAPAGMEWMVAKHKAAKKAKEEAEAASLRAKQASEAIAKEERHEMRQQSMAAAAATDGKLRPVQHRKSAHWVKRVAKELEDAEAAREAAQEAARLAAVKEATRREQEAAAAAAKAKADADAEAARRAAQAEVPIRVAKLHSQIDEKRAVAARVARAAGSANAVGVIAALEATANQALLPELGVRPHVRNAWGDADSDSSSGGGDSDDLYTDSEDNDDASSNSSNNSSNSNFYGEDPVVAAIASSLSGIRACRALSQVSDAL